MIPKDVEMTSWQRPVGFIGLGIMGEAMARRLVEAGTPLIVWNRSTGPAQGLARQGAIVARDAASVFAAADIVIFMLATEEAIDEVLGRSGVQFPALLQNRTLVNMGTVSPEYSRRLEADVERHGGRYVEAPVSGSRLPAENGELIALIAGEEEACSAVRPVLAPMCREIVRCGAVPAALMMKFAVNIFLITTVAGLAEAFHFAGGSGIDPATFRAVVDASPMASAVSRIKSGKLAAADFAPQAATGDVLKNVRLIAAQARATGLAVPLIDHCEALFAETLELGKGALDMAAVIHAFAARSRSAQPTSR